MPYNNDIPYLVKYRLQGDAGRSPRTVKVMARNQSDAKKAAIASIPDAKIIGGPKELKEGTGGFVASVAKWLSRCVGKTCLAYTQAPIDPNSGTLGHVRKRVTREIAQTVGNKLVNIGDGKAVKTSITVGKKRKATPRNKR